MRGATGYLTLTDPDQPLVERDTAICGHCQRVIFLKPNTAATVYLILDHTTLQYHDEAGAFCRVCMRPICLPCHDRGRCVPWERMMELIEARDRLIRQVLGG